MEDITIDAVRGKRCILIVIHNKQKHREFEYEQDGDFTLSIRDALFKWDNGDDDFKLPSAHEYQETTG